MCTNTMEDRNTLRSPSLLQADEAGEVAIEAAFRQAWRPLAAGPSHGSIETGIATNIQEEQPV